MNPQQSFGGLGALNDLQQGSSNNGPYAVDPTSWYKSLPYGFSFFDVNSQAGSTAKETFWLPISPNNVTVTTHYATNIVTTLYGVVEEHSEVRYYDIVIQGNTGYAPRFTTGFTNNPQYDPTSVGRATFEDPSLLGSGALGGFLPEVTNTINQVANIVSSIGEAINGVQNPTGIKPTQSGYVAFHNFYKFLLRYKEDAARVEKQEAGLIPSVPSAADLVSAATGGSGQTLRKVHPLQFLNYKDGIKYDVIPLTFTMVRSAENPMLYNYVLKLRGFNLQNVNAKPAPFQKLAELGLGGIDGQSLFSSMTSIAGNAATLVSGIL